MKNFKLQEFLNPDDHPSSGFVVCYHGKSPWTKLKKRKYTYLRIGDCHQTVNLHKTDQDSTEDFIKKLKLLVSTINKFIAYLEKS